MGSVSTTLADGESIDLARAEAPRLGRSDISTAAGSRGDPGLDESVLAAPGEPEPERRTSFPSAPPPRGPPPLERRPQQPSRWRLAPTSETPSETPEAPAGGLFAAGLCAAASGIEASCVASRSAWQEEEDGGPNVVMSKAELGRISELQFTEKAVFGTSLPAAPMLEGARWTVGLLVGAPLWSYSVAGRSSHWFFVCRTADSDFYYVAQFGVEDGRNVISEKICLGWNRVLKVGRQKAGEPVHLIKDWAPNSEVRTTWQLHERVAKSPCASHKYSFIFNNCQHFADSLYSSGLPSSV